MISAGSSAAVAGFALLVSVSQGSSSPVDMTAVAPARAASLTSNSTVTSAITRPPPATPAAMRAVIGQPHMVPITRRGVRGWLVEQPTRDGNQVAEWAADERGHAEEWSHPSGPIVLRRL